MSLELFLAKPQFLKNSEQSQNYQLFYHHWVIWFVAILFFLLHSPTNIFDGKKKQKHMIVVLDFCRHIKSQGQSITLPSTDFSCINHVNILTTNLEPISTYHFHWLFQSNMICIHQEQFSVDCFTFCVKFSFKKSWLSSPIYHKLSYFCLTIANCLLLFSQLPSPLSIGCRKNQRSKHWVL